jgi:branched-chain amino acid transport system substrate-binding protein
MRTKRISGVCVVAVLALSSIAFTAFPGAELAGAAAKTSCTTTAPGVTANSIKVGVVTPETGAAGETFQYTADGIKARFDAENAKGGVNGRKLEVVSADNATSPQQVSAAWKQLVEGENIFAGVGFDPLLFLAAPYLQQQGVPIVGYGLDGPEWAKQPYTNMFNWGQGMVFPTFPSYTQNGEFFKAQGVTKFAILATGINPSAKASAKAIIESVKKAGIDVVYQNLDVASGDNDFTADVLAMKDAGANGVLGVFGTPEGVALATAIKQGGLEMKAAQLGTSYSQKTLDDASVRAALDGSFSGTTTVPYELKTKATKQAQAAFKKYAKSAYKGGIPDFSLSGGYLSGDLIIAGLKTAGECPTRESFMSALSKVTDYSASGLLPGPVDLSHFGQAPAQTCNWFTQLKGDKFVPEKTKECGALIPGSDQL